MHSVLNEGLPFAGLLDVIVQQGTKLTKDAMENEKNNANRANNPIIGSISSYTKDLVMTFPLLTDTGISAETASMISRANERNIVTMFQMFFASQSFSGTNGIEILKSLHKNLGGKDGALMADIYKRIEDTAGGYVTYNESYQVQLNKLINEMVQELKTPKKSFPVNSFSETSLSDYKVLNIYGKTVVKEANQDKKITDPYSGNEIDKDQFAANQQSYNYYQKERENDYRRRREAREYKDKMDADHITFIFRQR